MVNVATEESPEHSSKFCKDCGAATTTQCEKCGAAIQGTYHHPEVAVVGFESVPSYCRGCGAPYPWTAESISAARTVVRELDGIDDEEKKLLSESVEALTRDSPTTGLAASRFKRLLPKLKSGSASVLKKIILELATEGAKKLIFG